MLDVALRIAVRHGAHSCAAAAICLTRTGFPAPSTPCACPDSVPAPVQSRR
jgi:hypothetical protein